MKKTIAMIMLSIMIISNISLIKAETIENIIEPGEVPGFYSTMAMVDEFGEVRIENSIGINVAFEETLRLYHYKNFYKLTKETFDNLDDEIKKVILSETGDNDNTYLIGLVDNGDGVYFESDTIYVSVYSEFVGDGRTPLLGKDYRLYLLENDALTKVDIKYSNDENVKFETDKLGLYVLYCNKNAYKVEFYEEYPGNEHEPFYVADNLGEKEIVDFPDIPIKDGYVFTGWKQEGGVGAYTEYFFVEPSNITAFDLLRVYASWCPVEEYTPLEITIESEEKIVSGKEDGAEITLTLSEGRFADELDSDIESQWRVVGDYLVWVESVERIDDTTVKLVLGGGSSSRYRDGELKIEFDSSLYISHGDFEQLEAHEIADIQLDENGIRKAMFISDNSVTTERQKKSSGGSSGAIKYTVLFETNGGGEVESQKLKWGDAVQMPENPVREGFKFAGWYADEELTEKYDFNTRVTGGMTLYAAWEEDEENKIILTVGEKKAMVFGKTVENDVAPLIENDRVMLPVRFVAESLGAKVTWEKENPDRVAITKGKTEIVIIIGEDYATVNGERVQLDVPAFSENYRTYLPVRFIAENLGCNVEWNEAEKQVVITK